MLAESVWILTLASLVLLSAVFLFVIANSGDERDYSEVQKKWYAIRSKWLLFLFVTGVIVTWATLSPFPITDQHAAADADTTVVKVVARQWQWEIDNTEYSAGDTVEFHVTSGDVNHGFAIYDGEDRLLTQTQAMPDYVNKVRHTFDQPGTYKVLCMEYCGLAHHAMLAQLTVR